MNVLVITNARLTKDPVLNERTIPSTDTKAKVCNFSVAVNDTNSAGVIRTDYFNVAAWRGAAEACQKYLRKGLRVNINGSVGLDTRIWNGKQYCSLAIHKAKVEFVDFAEAGEYDVEVEAAPAPAEEEDEIPFDV